MPVDFEHTFEMLLAPHEARRRFVDELTQPLDHMGWGICVQARGVLLLKPQFVSEAVLSRRYPLSQFHAQSAFRPGSLWRGLTKQSIRLEFKSTTAHRTRVTASGRVGSGFAKQLRLLGSPGHWPNNGEDPDWLPDEFEPLWNEQDSLPYEGEDAAQLDPISRRALIERRDERAAQRRRRRGIGLPVLITCPTTGASVPTGTWMTEAEWELADDPDVLRLTCPLCGLAHKWSRADAFLGEDGTVVP